MGSECDIFTGNCCRNANFLVSWQWRAETVERTISESAQAQNIRQLNLAFYICSRTPKDSTLKSTFITLRAMCSALPFGCGAHLSFLQSLPMPLSAHEKAAQNSRTPKPDGRSGAFVLAIAFWSAAVLRRFCGTCKKVRCALLCASAESQADSLRESVMLGLSLASCHSPFQIKFTCPTSIARRSNERRTEPRSKSMAPFLFPFDRAAGHRL